MEAFIKYVLGEMRVIADAPLSFTVALLVIAGVIWWAIDWRYSGILSNRDGVIQNRDSEIALLKSQRDDYKENLGGRSPDEAKARLDALESSVGKLLPRRLTEEQKHGIRAALNRVPAGEIAVSHEMSCADCNGYANDFRQVFSQAGWRVRAPAVMGIGATLLSSNGMSVVVPNPEQPTEAARLIIATLRQQNIPFEVKAQRPSGITPEPDIELIAMTR